MRSIKPLLLFATVLSSLSALQAATITYNLNCQVDASSCVNVNKTLATITLTDTPSGQVQLDLELFEGNKFRDLILNYGGASTTITSDDGDNDVELVANGFSLSPFKGLFDVGSGDNKGWNADSTTYSTILSGDGVTDLLASDFAVLNAPDQNAPALLYALIHIQACAGSCTGATSNSIKVGATAFEFKDDTPEVPEPSSYILLGTGLSAFAYMRRRRTAK